MVGPVSTHPLQEPAWDELLRPERLGDGTEPEQRIVYCAVSWHSYLAFDKKLGPDRPSPRLYYLDGELEIMTTSNEHERIKEWIGGFLEDYFLATGLETTPRGQATLRLVLKQAGAEPDKSWCIGKEKEFLDLVFEVALTHGGVAKLELYRRFNVPEVWFWRKNKIEIFVLEPGGMDEPRPQSRLLPGLDISLLEHCVALPSWHQARQAFRAGL